MAHTRQSRPDSDLGFQEKGLEFFKVFPLRSIGYPIDRTSGDTTPCRMTGATTPCRMTGVTLHGVVSPENGQPSLHPLHGEPNEDAQSIYLEDKIRYLSFDSSPLFWQRSAVDL